MQVEIETNISLPVCVLPSAVTIDSAGALSDVLKKLIGSSVEAPEFVIDASKVEIITTPGIQMIIAVGKVFERRGGKMTVKEPTEAFCRAFSTLGLDVPLKKWSALNG